MVSKKAVIDTETNAIDFSTGTHLSAITDLHLLVVKDYQTKDIWHYTKDNLKEAYAKLQEYDELIGHNIIGFDGPVLTKFLGPLKAKLTDTTILTRMAVPDKEGGHSLANWGLTLGFPKIEFSDWSGYSEDMLTYCIRDVEVCEKLYGYIMSVYSDGKSDKALELEHSIARIMAEQEARGVFFDRELADRLVSELSSKIEVLDLQVRNAVSLVRLIPGKPVSVPYKMDGNLKLNVVNLCEKIGLNKDQINGPFSSVTFEEYDLNSPDQQKKLLLENGWQPQSTTPTGQPQIDESITQVPIIGDALHERNSLRNRLEKVAGLVAMLGPTGRLHQGANTIGTPTSRMRHKRLANVPRVSRPFGYESRALFKATPGMMMVGYDASSLELRMLAHYIGDPNYTRLVMSKDKTDDAHTLAATAAGLTIQERDVGKTINYALIYGAGDSKLGAIINKGAASGRDIRSKLMHLIPGFKRLTDRVDKEAKKGFLYGLDGRRLILRQEYKGLNTLIQGGGAIFMKMVTHILDQKVKQLPYEAHKIIDMHDESQWEIEDSPAAIALMKTYIGDAFAEASQVLKLRCPQEPEIKSGYNWAETH
jgi:DNA polymerase I